MLDLKISNQRVILTNTLISKTQVYLLLTHGEVTFLTKNKNNLKFPPHLLAGGFFLLYICRVKVKNIIMLLVYRKQTRHRLSGRFKTYWKMSEWFSKNIKEEEYKYYFIVKSKNHAK